MSQSAIKIGGKLVRLCKPSSLQNTDVVGREREREDILAAWMGGKDWGPFSPLLIGAPGVGKTKVVYGCAKTCGKELYRIIGNEDIRAEDLLYTIVPDDNDKNRIHYIASPLVTAMIRGQVCFVDEIAMLRPQALAPLVSLLEESRDIQMTILNENLKAHPGFRFVAAANTADLKDGYLSEKISSRLKPRITFYFPDKAEIEQVVSRRYKSLQQNGASVFDCFWNLWSQKFGEKPPSHRDTIQLFGFALNFAQFEVASRELPLKLDHIGSAAISPKHMERAFELI